MKILIFKQRKLLQLWNKGACLREFAVGIGSVTGPKRLMGDRKTPEGLYRVVVKNPRSQFHRSLGISYPNLRDATVGLKEKRISEEDFRRIETAEANFEGTPWNTPLGGEIYLHGGLEDKPDTRGCVALNNADMEWLFDCVEVGTIVEILP